MNKIIVSYMFTFALILLLSYVKSQDPTNLENLTESLKTNVRSECVPILKLVSKLCNDAQEKIRTALSNTTDTTRCVGLDQVSLLKDAVIEQVKCGNVANNNVMKMKNRAAANCKRMKKNFIDESNNKNKEQSEVESVDEILSVEEDLQEYADNTAPATFKIAKSLKTVYNFTYRKFKLFLITIDELNKLERDSEGYIIKPLPPKVKEATSLIKSLFDLASATDNINESLVLTTSSCLNKMAMSDNCRVSDDNLIVQEESEMENKQALMLRNVRVLQQPPPPSSGSSGTNQLSQNQSFSSSQSMQSSFMSGGEFASSQNSPQQRGEKQMKFKKLSETQTCSSNMFESMFSDKDINLLTVINAANKFMNSNNRPSNVSSMSSLQQNLRYIQENETIPPPPKETNCRPQINSKGTMVAAITKNELNRANKLLETIGSKISSEVQSNFDNLTNPEICVFKKIKWEDHFGNNFEIMNCSQKLAVLCKLNTSNNNMDCSCKKDFCSSYNKSYSEGSEFNKNFKTVNILFYCENQDKKSMPIVVIKSTRKNDDEYNQCKSDIIYSDGKRIADMGNTQKRNCGAIGFGQIVKDLLPDSIKSKIPPPPVFKFGGKPGQEKELTKEQSSNNQSNNNMNMQNNLINKTMINDIKANCFVGMKDECLERVAKGFSDINIDRFAITTNNSNLIQPCSSYVSNVLIDSNSEFLLACFNIAESITFNDEMGVNNIQDIQENMTNILSETVNSTGRRYLQSATSFSSNDIDKVDEALNSQQLNLDATIDIQGSTPVSQTSSSNIIENVEEEEENIENNSKILSTSIFITTVIILIFT